jgi:hypothetical protein
LLRLSGNFLVQIYHFDGLLGYFNILTFMTNVASRGWGEKGGGAGGRNDPILYAHMNKGN